MFPHLGFGVAARAAAMGVHRRREARGFLPSDLSGLSLWLEADGITGLSSGDPISLCPDLSGNGNHATQSTAAYQPLWIDGVLNGLPVMRFDGVDDYLVAPNGAIAGLSDKVTVFVVQASTANSAQATFSTYVDDSANRFAALIPWYAANVYFDFGDIASGGRVYGSWGGVLGRWYLWSLLSWAGGQSIYRNSVNVVTDADSSMFTSSGKLLDIGRIWYLPTPRYFPGDIAAILIYTRALSDAERLQVWDYLNGKYALW